MIFTNNTIKCLAQLAPKKELRHYLNGAYFNLANKTIDIPALDGAFPDVRRVEADAERELDGACSLGRLSLDTVNHVNKALKPLGKSLSITPCVSTTWDYRKPVAFEIHGTAYRINLYVSLWVM